MRRNVLAQARTDEAAWNRSRHQFENEFHINGPKPEVQKTTRASKHDRMRDVTAYNRARGRAVKQQQQHHQMLPDPTDVMPTSSPVSAPITTIPMGIPFCGGSPNATSH